MAGKLGLTKSKYKPSFRMEVSTFNEGVKAYGAMAEKRITSYLDDECVEIEQYMKSKHPFKNRTGDAEKGLRCYYQRTGGGFISRNYRIILQHSVYYGKWLEYRSDYGTKYAIIAPTLEKKIPELIKGLKGLLD